MSYINKKNISNQVLLKNMVSELIVNEKITVGLSNKKFINFALSKLISFAKKAYADDTRALHYQRLALRRISVNMKNRTINFIKSKSNLKVNVLQKLFKEIAPRYINRNGGYTRATKIENRLGDNSPRIIITFV